MSDSKYGRLYTEDDVRDIVVKALRAGLDPENASRQTALGELIIEHEGAFPADEPLFVLRAQSCPERVLVDYRNEAQIAGAPINHIAGVDSVITAWRAWQQEHGTKVPD